MAFAFSASVAGVTTQLSDGNPFWLEAVEDAGPAPVIRHQQRSPLQQGVTDLGYRLQPRIMVLKLLFYSSVPATLDTYRSTLMSVFAPLTDTSVFLYAQRDDGTTRRLTGFVTDDIQIDLASDVKAANMHRATVKLRCADPLWFNTTVVQESFVGTTSLNWWTAGGTISASNVMEHVEYPTNGQAWSYAGTITGVFSIAFRSAKETGAGSVTAFHVGVSALKNAASLDSRFYYDDSLGAFGIDAGIGGTLALIAGTQNYMYVQDSLNITTTYYDGTVQIGADAFNAQITGTTRRWRSDRAGSASSYWTNDLPKAAVYNVELSSTQRLLLDTWMEGTAILGTVTAVNSGDVYEYPLITIRGPLSDPKLTNIVTGDVLDLAGLVIQDTDTFTVDLRSGDKKIYDASGVNRMGSVLYPYRMAGWSLAPSPIASGGSNQIRVQGGGSISTNTRVMVEHYNHYMSY